MTTFTGLWGTAVVYHGEILPIDPDDFLKGLLVAPAHSPLLEWFFEGCPQEDVLIVPSAWDSPLKQEFMRICQTTEMPRPSWKVANDWISFDARSCPPHYVCTVEFSAKHMVICIADHFTGNLKYQEMFPGMGFAAGTFNSEEWRYSVGSTIRAAVDRFDDDTDVLILGEYSGNKAELCQLICDTLITAGVMSYRVTIDDVNDVLTDQAYLESMAQQVAEKRHADETPVRKKWPWVAASLAVVAAVAIGGGVAAVKNSSPTDEIVISESDGEPLAANEPPESGTKVQGEWIEFPGGKLFLPTSWDIDKDSSHNIGDEKSDGPAATDWKRVFLPSTEPQMRVLVTVQPDPKKELAQQLSRELQNPDSIYREWRDPYFGIPLQLHYPIALSYQEISGETSRAEWVVIYNGTTALSFGCQYRMQDGMVKSKALRKCAPLLSQIKFEKLS